MSFFVNAPQEEAFNLVMDYFMGRRMKILTSNAPYYIRAEFGSWISSSLGSSKGEVETNIVKKNSESYVNLSLNFLKEYLSATLMTIGAALVTSVIYGMLGVDVLFTLSTILFIVAILWGIVGYDVSLTRRRFIEEFNMFIQSLASKKPNSNSTYL